MKPRIRGTQVEIGKNVRFGENVIIDDDVSIGDDCIIGDQVHLAYTRLEAGVRLERNVYLGYSTITGWFSKEEKPAEEKDLGHTRIGQGTLIRTDALIYRDVSIGANCWINHKVVIREQTSIGNRSSVGTMSDIEGDCTVGHRCSLHSQVHLCRGTVLENCVFIAPYTVTTNDSPMVYLRDIPFEAKGPIIRFGAQLAVHVVVLPGVEIGREAMVAAGALVSKDVPERKIVMGVPAKIVADLPEELQLDQELVKEFG